MLVGGGGGVNQMSNDRSISSSPRGNPPIPQKITPIKRKIPKLFTPASCWKTIRKTNEIRRKSAQVGNDHPHIHYGVRYFSY